ncbi:unnamed protein product [Cuscuta epithymum]|uniref:RNase H type-1 domain-containing protein n=1 Tax=Cuscuta epithymum TaxID=186058 RepID=A0AAV0FE17_9ASTE|nr:unnamed protein product [Cuscuta epithymum]
MVAMDRKESKGLAGASSSVQQLINRGQATVDGWQQVAKGRRPPHTLQLGRVSWSRPDPGQWKLIVDAATRAECCGLGWCLRDSDGQFVAGASKPWPGVLTALGAELVSIREALI